MALSFATPDEEAQYIATTALALRDMAFEEDDIERGLSWSDIAVLLRSVKANAEPIMLALQAAGIPFVVTGMTNLFGTSEAEAARQLSRWFKKSVRSVAHSSLEYVFRDLRAIEGGVHPPTFITGDSGGSAEGVAIMVRNKDIRLKFFCDISSSPAI